MLFPTVDYGVFFLCVFAAAWSVRRSLIAHKRVLLAASLAFYAFWDWRFLPLLIGISLLSAGVARGLQTIGAPRLRAFLLAGGIGACLGALAVFKYLGFAFASVLGLLELLGFHPGPVRLPEVAIPLGVSFFAFHGISLMVDAWRGKIPVRVTALDALLYVAFFPQLVAGPILRASSFLPQLSLPRPDAIDASRAFGLIGRGLVKKVLIAQLLATRLVDPVFESPGAHAPLEVLLAIYGYAVQIYCDFSGYSDLAIGSALLLGYQIPANFDAPYRANSPRDFWRRWHISLSTWLRDYLFIPLGGSRHGRARAYVCVAITMLLGGLWHGAAWTFVAWGAFHGAWLIAHRAWSESTLAPIRRIRALPAWNAFATVLTFQLVCFGWVLFRSASLPAALELLGALGNRGIEFSPAPGVLLAIAVGLGGQLLPAARNAQRWFARLPLVVQGLAFGLGILAIDVLGPRGVAPFIYFQF